MLFNAHLPPDWESYRTYVLPWSGHPTQPAGAGRGRASARTGGATVYASWNGATEVASWQVLAGVLADDAEAGRRAPASRSGFETAIPRGRRPAAGSYVAVQALNAAGAVIGSSPTVKLQSPAGPAA